MKHIIYLTTCLVTGKQYVGRHKVSNKYSLDPKYFGSGTLMKKMLKKYGRENFKRKILCKIDTEDIFVVKKLEIIYINKYNTLFPNGYNWIVGDMRDDNPMDYKRNRIKVGIASKRRMSNPENNPMFGKHHTEETKKMMSESRKGERNVWYGKRGKDFPRYGIPLTKECKDKISKALKGHKVSLETRKKISEKCIGRPSPMKGKKLDKITRKKISINHADFSGSKNPMYGSRFVWINNGIVNKRHNINEDIPNGWNKGMIFKAA